MGKIEERIEVMSRDQFNPRLKLDIISRLIAEDAEDLSDLEIDRCMIGCVGHVNRLAKMYRDCGYINTEDLKKKPATATME